MRDAAETIRQIEAAFADVPYPGREALFNHHCCECEEVSASYAGKPWTEIALEDVLAGRETSLLNPAAWRYYLPAMMIWCIRAPDTVDVIEDNLVYNSNRQTGNAACRSGSTSAHGGSPGSSGQPSWRSSTGIANETSRGGAERSRRGTSTTRSPTGRMPGSAKLVDPVRNPPQS